MVLLCKLRCAETRTALVLTRVTSPSAKSEQRRRKGSILVERFKMDWVKLLEENEDVAMWSCFKKQKQKKTVSKEEREISSSQANQARRKSHQCQRVGKDPCRDFLLGQKTSQLP